MAWRSLSLQAVPPGIFLTVRVLMVRSPVVSDLTSVFEGDAVHAAVWDAKSIIAWPVRELAQIAVVEVNGSFVNAFHVQVVIGIISRSRLAVSRWAFDIVVVKRNPKGWGAATIRDGGRHGDCGVEWRHWCRWGERQENKTGRSLETWFQAPRTVGLARNGDGHG